MTYNDSKLQEINDDMVQSMIPAIIYVAILMFLGILGNPLVIIFYGIKLKPTASYIFIVSVAVFDLIVCCISMPLEIVDLVQYYTFGSPAACKILRFVNYFASITSGAFLIAIAIDRYKKVCKPFKTQISNQIAKIMIILAMVIGFFLSWPSFVFYTVQEVNITAANGVIGFDCTLNRDEGFKFYITAYNVLLFMAFFIAIVTLIVLYTLIGKQLFHLKSFRFYKSNRKSTGQTSTQSSKSVSFKDIDDKNNPRDENVENVGEMRDGALSTIQEHEDDEDFGSVSRPGSAVQKRPPSSRSINNSFRNNNKVLPMISPKVATDRFNLDREYSGLTGFTESSGKTYKTTTTEMTGLSENSERTWKALNYGELGLNRENSGMTVMTGFTENSGKTVKTTGYGGLTLNRENSGMTEFTGLSEATGKTLKTASHGVLGINRENSGMTELTELSESSAKTFKTFSTGMLGLNRENSGMTELTDISDQSSYVKVVRPFKSTVKSLPKIGKSKPRINSAVTSVSSVSYATDHSNAKSKETRDARANGSIDDKKSKAQNLDTKKYTIIMMSITTAFVLSFLPYLGLVTWRTLAPDNEINILSRSELVALQIGLMSFMISSAANPFIYGFLNTEFRQFAFSFLCSICGCCRNENVSKDRSSNDVSKANS